MNIYVDTNVIISFVEQDVNYNKALKIRGRFRAPLRFLFVSIE